MNNKRFSDFEIVKRLELPDGKIDMVLDTDTFNEVDDQFALVYALNSPERLNVQAVYAAPFYNKRASSPEDGMEKSYNEIHNILSKMGREVKPGFVLKGAARYLENVNTPCDSEAARDLIRRAMSAEKILYVVAIGCITNVASAILMEPRIIEKITVVWLGGHGFNWPDTNEFNLMQDTAAARVVLDSGVPLVLLPCMGVASGMITTTAELEKYIGSKNEIGRYLTDIVKGYSDDGYAWSKVIWDIAAIAYLINPAWTPSYLTQSPILNEQFTYSFDPNRHLIRYVYHVYRDKIFADVFSKI